MNSQKGFTLLEVLVALVILSISLTVLLQIQTGQIKEISRSFKRIEALKYYKKLTSGVPVEKKFVIKVKKIEMPYGFKEVRNEIFEGDKPVLVFYSYEK